MVDSVALQAIVCGRVQGVFFRAFVLQRAKELGLSGEVRNLPDGAVEVRAERDRQQLEKLVSYLEVGPPAAKVSKVMTNWTEYTGGYSGFIIRH